MNNDLRCKGCRYNTFKTKGGNGKICNGITMTKHDRCPEWVINEYLSSSTKVWFSMNDVVLSNKVWEVK